MVVPANAPYWSRVLEVTTRLWCSNFRSLRVLGSPARPSRTHTLFGFSNDALHWLLWSVVRETIPSTADNLRIYTHIHTHTN